MLSSEASHCLRYVQISSTTSAGARAEGGDGAGATGAYADALGVSTEGSGSTDATCDGNRGNKGG